MRAMDIIVIGILAIHLSAIAFARGAWTGVLIIRTPTAVKAALNAAVNVVSWSRSRNLMPSARSARVISRFRACWVTTPPSVER